VVMADSQVSSAGVPLWGWPITYAFSIKNETLAEMRERATTTVSSRIFLYLLNNTLLLHQYLV